MSKKQKDRYPYEVRGNGYIHRPSWTYLTDGKFFETYIKDKNPKQDVTNIDKTKQEVKDIC